MFTLTTPDPGSRAARLIGRDYLSYSSISTYQTCPLRFYFRYVLELPETPVSSSLAFGGAVHAAIEFHHRQFVNGRRAPNPEALLDVFWAAWSERTGDGVRFGKGEDLASLGGLADRLLKAFRASELARPAGRIVGVEETLRGQLARGCPDILARVDLMLERGDTLVVRDYKTSRSRWTASQLEQASEQLMIYGILAGRLDEKKSIALECVVLTKTKAPAVHRHGLVYDENRVQRTREVITRVWRAIEAEHFYPAPSPLSCPSCPFRERCRVWSG